MKSNSTLLSNLLAVVMLCLTLLAVSCKSEQDPAPEVPELPDEELAKKDSLIVVFRERYNPMVTTRGKVVSLSLATGHTRTIAPFTGYGNDVTRSGNNIYIISQSKSSYGYTLVDKIDIASGTLIKSGNTTNRVVEESINIVADDKKLYVLYHNPFPSHVSVVNAETLLEEDTISLYRVYPTDLLVTDGKLFVPAVRSVRVYDVATLNKIGTVDTKSESGTGNMVLDKNNNILLTAAQSVLNPSTLSVTKLFEPYPFDWYFPKGFYREANLLYFRYPHPQPSPYPYSIWKYDYNTGMASVVIDGWTGAVPNGLMFIRFDERNKLIVLGSSTSSDRGLISTFDMNGKPQREYLVDGVPLDVLVP